MARAEETRSKIGGWPLAAGIAVVLVFLFFVRYILLPFILAAALAFILTPLLDHLHQRLRVPRWAVALVAYFCVLALLGGILYFVGGVVVRDVGDIVQRFPQMLQKLVSEIAGSAERFAGPSLNPNTVTAEILNELRSVFSAGAALAFAGYGIAAVFGTILALVLLIYFLISGKEIAAGAFWLVPPEYRGEVDRVMRKILPVLRRYFIGLLLVVLYTSTVAWIGLGLIFHIPHAILLAIVIGLLELVPVIGPAASMALILLNAIEQTGVVALITLAVFALALRISIDQVVGPFVLGTVARVHPVVVIFAFLSGAVLFGVIGLLLAVPVAASIKIILSTYYAEPIAEEQHPAPAQRASLRR